MPLYDYRCRCCGWTGESNVRIADRDNHTCPRCNMTMDRDVSSALFRFKGVVTPGGGIDRFTADMIGVPLKELPEGLKTK